FTAGPVPLRLLAIAEGVAEALEDIGAARRRRIARGIVLGATGVEDFDLGVEMRIVEERDRIALSPRAVDDAMLGRREKVVGPACQQIADIDHEGAGDRRCVDPAAILAANLETAIVVLPEQGETAVLGMRGD